MDKTIVCQSVLREVSDRIWSETSIVVIWAPVLVAPHGEDLRCGGSLAVKRRAGTRVAPLYDLSAVA